MRVLLDTNIVLRYVHQADPEHVAVRGALRRLLAVGHTPCICSQNVYELWTVATRPVKQNGLGLSPDDARLAIDDLRLRFPLLPGPVNLIDRWVLLCTRYQVQGKQGHDTRLVALMLEHGVTHILTLNTGDFARFAEITCLSPADVP